MGVREQIVADLTIDGDYEVRAQVVDAADFGVPQTRKRLLFVGVRRGMGMSAPRLAGSGATDLVALARFTGDGRPRYQLVTQQNLLSARLVEALADKENLTAISAFQALSDLASLPVGHREDEMSWDDLPSPESAYQRLMRNGQRGKVIMFKCRVLIRIQNCVCVTFRKAGNHRDLQEKFLERYLTGQRWGQENGTGRLSRKHFYAYRRLYPRCGRGLRT